MLPVCPQEQQKLVCAAERTSKYLEQTIPFIALLSVSIQTAKKRCEKGSSTV